VIETSPGVAWTANGVTFERLLAGARERSTDGEVAHVFDVADASFGLVLHRLPSELHAKVLATLQQECAAVDAELTGTTDPGDQGLVSSLGELAALLAAVEAQGPGGAKDTAPTG
jgi:hypothetical protein